MIVTFRPRGRMDRTDTFLSRLRKKERVVRKHV